MNEWDRGTRPGLSAYFLDNGLMFRTFKPQVVGPFTSASNAGGLELVDWDNNTVWSYQFNTAEWLSHHDAFYMPNGNILVLTWELVYEDELIELGRNPSEIANEGYMWSEKIIEVEPIGDNDINIVWEWNIKDHYIQDYDDTKSNFGVIADHPELFDINLPDLNSSNSNSPWDWNHFNAIDYNQELDQILLSVRNSDEIWILDHSTTTLEAASHSGGLSGMGGDILYRWGNASAYKRAAISQQKLFGQHGVNWIREGLTDAGKILIYNNGNGRPGPDYSTAEIITPPYNGNGQYIIESGQPFGPLESEWKYGEDPGQNFYSPYLSNAQRLSNGNTLINAGSAGYVFEINPEQERVWEYIIPLSGDFPFTQGQNANNNASFRAYKFPPDFAGFNGIELTQGATIELGNSPVDCELFVEINEQFSPISANIIYLASSNSILIDNPELSTFSVKIVDVSGRLIAYKFIEGLREEISLSSISSGLLFVQIQTGEGAKSFKVFHSSQ